MTGATNGAASPAFLAQPLAGLLANRRARRVCQALGITTVAEFLQTPRQQFLAHKGCGQHTYATIEQSILEHLHAALQLPSGHADADAARALPPLVRDRRATRAFLSLGITTVGQFLALPREQLLAVPGFGRATHRRVLERIRATRPVRAAVLQLLPAALLELQLERAALGAPLLARLRALGCTTFAQLLAMPEALFADGGELSPRAAAEIRACLDQLFRVALEHVDTLPVPMELDYATLKGRLLAPLPDADRELVCRLLGLGTAVQSPGEVATAMGLDHERVAALIDAARELMHERAPSILGRLRHEVASELQAFEGLVTGDHLAAGSLLHTLAKGGGDPQLPLRLSAFCFPNDFQLQEGCLTTLPPRQFERFQRRLRLLTAAGRLPVSIERLVQELRQITDPVPRGLLLHLLRHSGRLTVQIDATAGEMVLQSQHSVPGRLRDILHEEGHPLSLEDLVFHYRDRFRSVRQQRLRRHLRLDPMFVEIGPRLWSLRSWHQDELKIAASLAADVAARVLTLGGKQYVPALLQGEALGERTVHLVLDCLRRDASVRYLGRGEVCPATHSRSQVLEQLLKDFRRAGSEVVLSMFLANQPAERRRLVTRLLHENRLFVQVAADRIDALTNYPFNDQRLQQLLEVVQDQLEQRGGYAAIGDVLTVLNGSDLGGSWLTELLLGDLLRRHGNFELLPAGVVAKRELMLI
ncbi:MAG TPA: helix-hairpin-helix domain-containing protein, partial [Planctomycetota bacterium]|nr:helix-hairpin-helix domain-containing protein [Planctomycetota bacterium]